MTLFDELAQQFSKFPGIGPRQARRFVYFLLSTDEVFTSRLVRLITELRRVTHQCPSCFRFFEQPGKETERCSQCSSPNTDPTRLLIVEKDMDIPAIEKSGAYQGRFFVLGGIVPFSETASSRVRATELSSRVERQAREDGLREIIFALSANPEGDHTRHVLIDALRPILDQYNITITTLGRGLSTGTELEYADDETIKNALERRS